MLILSRFIEGYFIVFIAYEALCMLFALTVYSMLSFKHKSTPDYFMVAGILLTITGAVIQALRSIHFTIVWEFDYNSVYHIVQMLAVYLMYLGVVKRIKTT
jgi:hypothetical protein